MAIKNLLLSRYLSSMVQRLKLLLSLGANKWILCSLVASRVPTTGCASSANRACSTAPPAPIDLEDYCDACSSFGPSRTTSPIGNVSRANSRPRIGSATPEDIDKRAEIFIADFYRHFWLERQVSPQLRLCNDKPSSRWFPWPSPISPDSYFSFMSKFNVPVPPASSPPISTAVKISPRATSSSIRYPDPVPPLMKGRPTIVIQKTVASSNCSRVQEIEEVQVGRQ